MAIDEGLIAPCSKVPDVPLYFVNFSPQNANKKYYGIVEIQDALIKSLNIPFVSLLKEYGEEKFFYFLKEVFSPQNANKKYYGIVEIQDALIKSLNIPFVSLLKEYGEEKFFYFLKEVLGFSDDNLERVW